LSKKWQIGSNVRIQNYFFPSFQFDSQSTSTSPSSSRRWRSFAVVMVGMAILQSLAASPFFLQRMIVRFIQPFVLGGLMLMWVQVSGDPVNLTLFCVILSLFVGVIAYRYYIDQINSNHRAASAVAPVIVEDDSQNLKKQGREKEKDEKEDSKVTSTGSAEHSSSFNSNHYLLEEDDNEDCPIIIIDDMENQFRETDGIKQDEEEADDEDDYELDDDDDDDVAKEGEKEIDHFHTNDVSVEEQMPELSFVDEEDNDDLEEVIDDEYDLDTEIHHNDETMKSYDSYCENENLHDDLSSIVNDSIHYDEA